MSHLVAIVRISCFINAGAGKAPLFNNKKRGGPGHEKDYSDRRRKRAAVRFFYRCDFRARPAAGTGKTG
jgi:hypothetical protein